MRLTSVYEVFVCGKVEESMLNAFGKLAMKTYMW